MFLLHVLCNIHVELQTNTSIDNSPDLILLLNILHG